MIKRTLAILALALALVLSLAACGTGNNGDANNADNGATAGSPANNGGTGAESPADRAGNGMTDPANGTGGRADPQSPVNSANNGAGMENPADNNGITAPNGAAIYGGMNGSGRDRSIRGSDGVPADPDWNMEDAQSRTRYALMLDNGRVRDTDGFLFDGENPQHNTFF